MPSSQGSTGRNLTPQVIHLVVGNFHFLGAIWTQDLSSSLSLFRNHLLFLDPCASLLKQVPRDRSRQIEPERGEWNQRKSTAFVTSVWTNIPITCAVLLLLKASHWVQTTPKVDDYFRAWMAGVEIIGSHFRSYLSHPDTPRPLGHEEMVHFSCESLLFPHPLAWRWGGSLCLERQ